MRALLERLEREEDTIAEFGLFAKPFTDKPGKLNRVLDARLRERDLAHSADDGFGAIERRRVGQLRDRDEVLLVLRRHEAGRHARESDDAEHDEAGVHRERNRRATRDALHDVCRSALDMRANARLNGRNSQPKQRLSTRVGRSAGAPRGLSSTAASAGDSVSELNAEISVENAIVSANCR